MFGGLWSEGGTPMSSSSSASSYSEHRHRLDQLPHDGWEERSTSTFSSHECFNEIQVGFLPPPEHKRYSDTAAHPTRPLPFIIIREADSSGRMISSEDRGDYTDPETLKWRVSGAPVPERTSSGLSITAHNKDGETRSNYSDMRKDEQAAVRVERHFAQHHQWTRGDSKAERILKSLISPKSSPGQEFEIDDDALLNIFRAANEIFFHNSLNNRVRWDWSHGGNERYQTQIIGQTALRQAKNGGYETLIVLSYRYLKDKRYNRRLLISAFLHELIHSYLFIRCGFKAKRLGGHTEGFRRIAQLIDQWAGPDTLFLSNMEADLDNFDDYRNCGGQCSADINGHSSTTTSWHNLR